MKQIKLTQPHVHAGVSYSAGDVIDVTNADAVYLIRHQIGVAVKSAINKSNKPTEPAQIEQPGNNTKAEFLLSESENQNQGEQ